MLELAPHDKDVVTSTSFNDFLFSAFASWKVSAIYFNYNRIPSYRIVRLSIPCCGQLPVSIPFV